MYTEEMVSLSVRQQRDAGLSLRAIAAQYPDCINHADIERILLDPPQFPVGREKRQALGIPMSTTVVVVGDGEIPPGAQVIHARICPCGQPFIPNNPNRSHCFICSPYKKASEK